MSGPTPERRRTLGLTSAAALVVANMIGAGVFTTSGFLLADLGRPELVLLAWLVGGVIATCGALSYGALARRMPESGGEYYFLSRTFHPLVGFLAGWISLFAGFTAPIAVAAISLQEYLTATFEVPLRPQWIGTGAILLAAAVHALRSARGTVLQNLAVALKLVAIAAFVAFGAVRIPQLGVPAPPPSTTPFELGAFAVSLVWISFAYSGWNAAVYVAGEVRDPNRNLARSLWLATAVVTACYLALNAVFVYSAPVGSLADVEAVGVVAADSLGGPTLARALSALVALALLTSISAMVMAGPRVYARMADDGLFPRLFESRRALPVPAIALQAGLAILVVWISDLRDLFNYIGLTLGLSTATTVAALVVLRRREGPGKVPIPGYPWIPALFLVSTLSVSAFLVWREWQHAALGLATVAAGVPAYYLIRRRTS